MGHRPAATLAFGVLLLVSPTIVSSPTMAQQALVITPLVEKKVTALPTGPLFWTIETFGTAAQAKTAAGPTGLVAETAGKVWLFTLGPSGRTSANATRVAEVGPIPAFVAAHYLLRINEARGPPGSVTPVHTHAGSEAFYVLAGETSQKSPHGTARAAAGQSLAGHGGGMPMQVSSTGSTDLHSLVMFLVDADKPFSSPAKF